jgi:hypothetical protein
VARRKRATKTLVKAHCGDAPTIGLCGRAADAGHLVVSIVVLLAASDGANPCERCVEMAKDAEDKARLRRRRDTARADWTLPEGPYQELAALFPDLSVDDLMDAYDDDAERARLVGRSGGMLEFRGPPPRRLAFLVSPAGVVQRVSMAPPAKRTTSSGLRARPRSAS